MTYLERLALRRALPWLAWAAVLAVATFILYQRRTTLEQVHVVLVFLMIVLGGTAYGGRLLGLVLAVSGFILIDYFFQSPFDRLTVGSSLDWFVLVAFLVTAAVTTNLLGRAQRSAARAQRHASEVAHLSRLGSELLSAGRADDALAAIVEAVRETVQAETCVAFAVHGEDDVEPVARSGTGSFDLAMVRRVAREGIDIGERPDGTVVQRMPTAATLNEADRSWSDGGFDGSALRSLWLPLRVRDRIVGVLGASCQTTLALDDTHWRFAHALRFYAALALERVRLVAATEHAEAMRETDRLRNALLASVSHDLRTPLTTIKALAQESVTQRDPELALANALVIEEHADRLARVVSNVLDVTRLRAKTMPVHIEFNTAEDLVGAVARQCAGVLGDHPLERRIDEDGGLLAGSFDFVQSLRVLTNLVENAARYSPPGAPVTLSARRDGAQVVFEVADRGPGVPPLQRERIFEPFYRLPGAAPDIGGTGLGLYIARGLAEAQGGTVTYAPRLPHGSVFTLHLPAIDIGETVPNDAEEREEIA